MPCNLVTSPFSNLNSIIVLQDGRDGRKGLARHEKLMMLLTALWNCSLVPANTKQLGQNLGVCCKQTLGVYVLQARGAVVARWS